MGASVSPLHLSPVKAIPNPNPKGILDRYIQIRPRIIFAETEIVYAGKIIDLIPTVREVIRGLAHAGVQNVVLLPSVKTGIEVTSSDISRR
jgi:acetoacetyl-CoA synthetase